VKVGDLVRDKRSVIGMMGVIVEIVSWRHTENKTPFVLWSDGRCDPAMSSLLEVISEGG
jgi:hypothetical protein